MDFTTKSSAALGKLSFSGNSNKTLLDFSDAIVARDKNGVQRPGNHNGAVAGEEDEPIDATSDSKSNSIGIGHEALVASAMQSAESSLAECDAKHKQGNDQHGQSPSRARDLASVTSLTAIIAQPAGDCADEPATSPTFPAQEHATSSEFDAADVALSSATATPTQQVKASKAPAPSRPRDRPGRLSSLEVAETEKEAQTSATWPMPGAANHPISHSPPIPPTRQSSLLTTRDTHHLDPPSAPESETANTDTSNQSPPGHATTSMQRKIWVKRPSGSATLVPVSTEDLVDDVRDMLLRKYANSLGRQFDAPDLTICIVPRGPQRQERILGPDESMLGVLDSYFPGGQGVDEALVIDVPARRTLRLSPRIGQPHVMFCDDSARPTEADSLP